MISSHKRISSDSLNGDRKRTLFERYDCRSHNKRKYNTRYGNNGRQNHVAVPNNYYTPASQYVEPYRQTNFKYEAYIDSLQQCESRNVSFYDLRRYLFNINIRSLHNGNFTTTLELTVELESSLKNYIDTRNELIFLRKLQREQCTPFSYNEININNRNALYNRIQFLEHVSTYRSNVINKLFHLLQSVVIPSIIDDIRCIHNSLYEKSWTNRASHWFRLFKQIKSEKISLILNGCAHKYRQLNTQRSHRSHKIKDESDFTKIVNIKSQKIAVPRSLTLDKSIEVGKPYMQCESPRNVESLSDLVTSAKITKEKIESFLENIEPQSQSPNIAEAQLLRKYENLQVDLEADEGNDSDSCEIIEPNVIVVTVTDDDNDNSTSDSCEIIEAYIIVVAVSDDDSDDLNSNK